jgi:HTH-type transcriptional regulator, sugar sensing transcriptional regulator
MKMTNPQGFSTLLKLGLSEDEIMVYHALLGEVESTSIRALAARTGINRGAVYEALKNLVSINLVSYNRKGDRKYYFAERPSHIFELIEDRKRELEALQVRATSLVPRMEAISKRHNEKPIVRFYEHDEGVVNILHDLLKTTSELSPKEYYAYSSRAIRPYMYRSFPNFNQQRLKLGVHAKVIKIGEGAGPVIPYDECKWLKESGSEDSASYSFIYGDKVAMVSVSADETPYGVIIQERGVAVMQKLLFDKLWSSLPAEVT